MNLLSKFENIEIKNDTRISADDLAFCEENQKLYDKILDNYRNIYEQLIKLREIEDSQFDEIKDQNTVSTTGYTHKKYDYHFITANKEDFTKTIIGVHKIFINTIYSYFAETYGIKLAEKSVEDILDFEKPNKPDNGYYGYRIFADEEIERLRKRNEEYEKSLDKYRDCIISARIDYNAIIDDIFIQLDGYSFADKSKREIIDNCKQACMPLYCKSNFAELKKDKISIKAGFHSHYDSIWKEYQASTDNNDFKAIMRALTFFDSKENNTYIYDSWLCEFVDYNKRERDGIYGLHRTFGNKVESLKFYKNGKWEVKFISENDAEEFYNTYCKSEV